MTLRVALDRLLQRQRYAEPAREQVHRSGRQHGKRLARVHDRRRRRRDRSVAAARENNFDVIARDRAIQRRDDLAAFHDLDLDAVARALHGPGHEGRQRGEVGGPQGTAIAVQDREKLHGNSGSSGDRVQTREARARGINVAACPRFRPQEKGEFIDALLQSVRNKLKVTALSAGERATLLPHRQVRTDARPMHRTMHKESIT